MFSYAIAFGKSVMKRYLMPRLMSCKTKLVGVVGGASCKMTDCLLAGDASVIDKLVEILL